MFIQSIKNISSNKKRFLKERELYRKIEDGFEKDEFKMYLQFVVDNKTKKLVSAEALSRWESSSGEILMPGAYIGLIERAGLIAEFDYYMFDKVCAKLAEWSGTVFGGISISCNFTRITVSERDFVSKICDIADKYDFNRRNLIIEITEDSFEKNMDAAMYNIFQIKNLGFRIALDDIGNGYTSFMSLCKYPIDVVKIDRSILRLANDEKGKKLFHGIISLALYLNLTVVCEGVENEEQNSLASKSDCDCIQGWYYSRVLPVKKAESFAMEYMIKFA